MSYILGKEEVEAVRQVIERGHLDRYIDGENSVSSRFEKNFANKIGVKHALAVSSGTAALICGLAGMGVGPRDEVIIPSFTYIATALAPLAVGAVPIIAEIDQSLTIDPLDIERRITPQTKAIIPVHMHGLPCNMSAIVKLAKQHNLMVLEDVAQACGGSYQGQKLGSIGDVGIFSFNHYKIITCGEGGALVTNNTEFFQRAMIQHHGGCIFEIDPPALQVQTFAGWNFRISEILSAILQVQLTRLDNILASLCAEKNIIVDKLTNTSDAFQPCPVNDQQGDCGTTVFLSFNSAEQAKTFIQQATKANIDVWFPGTKGHVFTDWEPILEKRGAHHIDRDGFRFTMKPLKFNKDMCPQTLSILKRTVGISTKVNRSREELHKLIDNIITLGTK